MTNREAFVTALAVLGATFDRKLSAPAIEGYWLVLSDLSEDDFKALMKRALSECKFMPSPAELLSFARPRRNPATDAIQVWQAVRKAIDVYDWNVGTIDFGPLVNAVIRNLGGWDTLCRATLPELDNPGWLRKRFEEVYALMSVTEPTALHGEPLAGKLPPLYQAAPQIVVQIDGQPPRPRLEASGADAARASIAAHVRDLAERKAASNG